jgi:seryl-tRNA synthetase
MIDIQDLRARPEAYKEAAKQKGYQVDIDKLLELDAKKQAITRELDEVRQARNELAASLKQSKPTEQQIQQGREYKDKISNLEAEIEPIENSYQTIYKSVPNLPEPDVPVGATEEENQVVKEWGQKPEFDFTPKTHWEIAEARDLIDKERAAKVTGSRFAYIKGGLVQLQLAIMQFTVDTLTNEELIAKIIEENNLKLQAKPFVPILPPAMIRESVYDQMDRLEPREDRYHIDGDDDNLWLIGSAEHTLGSMYAGEILPEADLPIRYIGYSTSFRQEAGTYGKDTEGIIRMHQFDKLEMEVFSTKETSRDEHLLLIALQEYMMQQLNIPYRLLLKCTADIGKPNARGVDIDAWLPGRGDYKETHTADYMTDYQSRRLQSRVRRADNSVELLHTNDATAFALGRTMAAIIENYQTADGAVRIPDVLKAYMGRRETI